MFCCRGSISWAGSRLRKCHCLGIIQALRSSLPALLCPDSASTDAGAALSAIMTRAVSPPEATAPSGRSASAGPAASRNSTLHSDGHLSAHGHLPWVHQQ